jgi:four helix bundle protein
VDLIDAVNEQATFAGPVRYRCMLHFQKLDLYRRSIEFLVVANRLRRQLPRGNAELADQLRRAAQSLVRDFQGSSIPQNIAEGCGRTTRADKARHYTIARGSAMECAAHLDVMRVDELINHESYDAASNCGSASWRCSRDSWILDRRR